MWPSMIYGLPSTLYQLKLAHTHTRALTTWATERNRNVLQYNIFVIAKLLLFPMRCVSVFVYASKNNRIIHAIFIIRVGSVNLYRLRAIVDRSLNVKRTKEKSRLKNYSWKLVRAQDKREQQIQRHRVHRQTICQSATATLPVQTWRHGRNNGQEKRHGSGGRLDTSLKWNGNCVRSPHHHHRHYSRVPPPSWIQQSETISDTGYVIHIYQRHRIKGTQAQQRLQRQSRSLHASNGKISKAFPNEFPENIIYGRALIRPQPSPHITGAVHACVISFDFSTTTTNEKEKKPTHQKNFCYILNTINPFAFYKWW